ncbi:hypothetical protein OPW41_07710 [Vibrio europaeus]|uniref:hypothetical protein n=1 Tax=Vibrio europaeus TaxID=300876 RepID=UPI00233EE1C3|nr:hypothetical protein [Vibrio europaeus]MDC5757027.1 hypothetical protein [Vibrio europaeus]MDC5775567.1 hypothetical protein [Vibrio europaeus]MDC5794705.1 hypothetical protein [Vibrio europaeus]MDC5800976.1 hypothetical protein [Vibrio europaeus]MDC5816983.1 hypothetical protein [Vibrio europaeus]
MRDEIEKAKHLARLHARQALQEQTLHTPKEFDVFEKSAYESELYKWADKVVGYDS